MCDENSSTVISTRKLTKVFRDFWLREKVSAVRELNLDVMPREVFGLLGPNGSGKSTTIKMILGLLHPTRGVVSVFAKRPADVATKARIGFLPEETYLYPFLDGWETLDFYGQLFHQPRRERRRRIEMLLEMVGLKAVAYRRIGEYSKGMQRRIGLAQALINDPDLLILDEPTSGMDPIAARQIKDIICTLASRGKTVLLSSHLLADVEDVCDRVCILYGGMERAKGPISQLLAKSDLTQLTTGRLDDVTIEKIRNLVEQAIGAEVDVSTPRDKLESLFLRIVEDARIQRLSTGGAIDGGEVAEFLRKDADQPKGEQVISQLVEGGRQEEQETDQAAVVAQSEVDAQAQCVAAERKKSAEAVVDKLVETAASASLSKAETPPDTDTHVAPADDADLGIIEGLIRRNDDEEQQ